ncbi:NMRAL1 isoform 3 [Pan troglodytes]|uniref:NmrA like redox sensor 1 n=2 Tax=Homininae TaxID=207598 RepID=I3L2U0_HUMAN|nr:NMRAL1 isoform 3 [Pan troglodytes]
MVDKKLVVVFGGTEAGFHQAKIVPLHFSLGDRVRLHLKKIK